MYSFHLIVLICHTYPTGNSPCSRTCDSSVWLTILEYDSKNFQLTAFRVVATLHRGRGRGSRGGHSVRGRFSVTAAMQNGRQSSHEIENVPPQTLVICALSAVLAHSLIVCLVSAYVDFQLTWQFAVSQSGRRTEGEKGLPTDGGRDNLWCYQIPGT